MGGARGERAFEFCITPERVSGREQLQQPLDAVVPGAEAECPQGLLSETGGAWPRREEEADPRLRPRLAGLIDSHTLPPPPPSPLQHHLPCFPHHEDNLTP
jgi:hypothetical protein